MRRELEGHHVHAIEAIMSAEQSGASNSHVGAYMAPGTGATLVALEVAKRICRMGTNVLLVTQSQVELHQAQSVFRDLEDGDTPPLSLNELLDLELSAQEYYVVFSTFQYAEKNGFWEKVAHRCEVIIFLNMSFSRPSRKTESIGQYLNSTQLISISPAPPTSKQKELFGTPVFSYTIKDAIHDGILMSVEYNVMPSLIVNSDIPIETNEHVIATIFSTILERKPSKILIVCKDLEKARSMAARLEDNENAPRHILLTSDLKNLNKEIDEFCRSKKYLIGISVNLHQSLDIRELTDVIVLKKITSESNFLSLLSKVNKRGHSVTGRRVWDFHENGRWFKEAYGELIDHDSYSQLDVADKVFFESTELSTFSDTSEGVSEINLEAFDSEIQIEQGTKSEKENGEDTSTLPKNYIRKLADPKNDEVTEIDLLGREGLVSILKGVIDRDSRKHFIVALFGRWGSGKSSVIKILKSHYKKSKDTHFIIFNAWQNGHSQNMTASIAETCVQSIYKTKNVSGKIFLSLRGQYQDHKPKLLFYGGASFTILTFLISYLGTKYFSETGLTFNFRNSALYGAIISALPAIFWGFIKNPFVNQVEELSKQPSFGAHIGISESIKQQLNGLLTLYPKTILPTVWNPFNWAERCCIKRKGYPYKYILVVDDLDRCSENKIIEVLETVQLVIDLDNVVVILVVDDEILLRAVGGLYLKQRKGISSDQAFKIAREFLGKILQVTITLDQPSISARERFIRKRLYNDLEIESQDKDEFVEQLGFDPKESYDDRAIVIDDEPTDLFDYENYYDEDENTYDETDEYLNPDLFEFNFFNVCMEAFEIDNPRALLRLHNVITFIKGLYPVIAEDEKDLKMYIYLVFWYEKYQSADENDRKAMYASIESRQPEVDDQVSKLANAIKISSESIDYRKRAIYRIKNLSLPVLEVTNGMSNGTRK